MWAKGILRSFFCESLDTVIPFFAPPKMKCRLTASHVFEELDVV